MPTKRTFDLIVITAILIHPAVGLLKMAARRWKVESTGLATTAGKAIDILTGP